MVICVECLPADKPWDVVSVTRRSSGVAPRACVRVYARVLVPPNLYIHTYINVPGQLAQVSVVQTKKWSESGECGTGLMPFIVLSRDYPCTTWLMKQSGTRGRKLRLPHIRGSQSINQSKILTKPHTHGPRRSHIPAPPQG